VTANAQFAQIASTDRRFYKLLHDAEVVVADGMSVVAASRILGHPLPQRIAGIDLVIELCREAARSGLSVYLLGGRPCAAKKAADNLNLTCPGLRVAGVDCPPLGFSKDPAESAAVVRRISSVAPDILLVAFGAPKQEFWMEEHAAKLPVKVMIGVGCSFDVLAGFIRRAPRWMQKVGLEWVFRTIHEPRRLWKRYLLGNVQFVQAVIWQYLTGRDTAYKRGIRTRRISVDSINFPKLAVGLIMHFLGNVHIAAAEPARRDTRRTTRNSQVTQNHRYQLGSGL